MLNVTDQLLRSLVLLASSATVLTAPCINHTAVADQAAAANTFRAAVGKLDITPTGPAFLAGYSNNRRSFEAHDRLTARCLVVDRGKVRVAFVSCDLIGLPRFEIQRIRSLVKSVAPENVVIGGTHTHSGPDTLGMWGAVITSSGVDQNWLEGVRAGIAALVDRTADQLKPASIRYANTTDVPKISKNIRIPRILDTELSVMQIVSADGAVPIATLVNYACHPEILNNRQITADFPHWLYETVELGGGGECIYFNGAQGGMITADYDESTAPKGENWKAAETIGNSLGTRVLEILKGSPTIPNPVLYFSKKVFTVPLENQRYLTLIKMKVFSGQPGPDGTLETEVCRIGIGQGEFITIPGEALPNVGFYLKRQMRGHPRFLLGLTNDFLGYILTPEDFGLNLYGYESGQSVGSSIEPLMISNQKALISASAQDDAEGVRH